jgi:hypothetical protein
MYKLGDENAEHMPIGFEVAFPSLIDIARKLSIDIPDDSHPILQEIYDRRNLKLSRYIKAKFQNQIYSHDHGFGFPLFFYGINQKFPHLSAFFVERIGPN